MWTQSSFRSVVVDYQSSFVDGIGGKCVLPEMCPMLQEISFADWDLTVS